MTTAAVLPALLVAHDPLAESAIERVQWVVGGAGRAVVGCTASTFDVNAVRPALAEVGALDSFLVIHVIGPLEDPELVVSDRGADPVGALVQALESVHRSIADVYPGKKGIDQWVVHTVGQVIDPSERRLLDRLSDLEPPGLRGVIVSASATHASVTHDADEQAGFAADVILALVATDIEQHLADADPLTWIAGATSLTYAGTRLADAVSAYHAVRALDEGLLQPSPPGDPAFDLGGAWLLDLDLAAIRERDLLLASPAGGSLLARIRMDEIDWDSVPLTSWADVLTTRQQLLASQEFDAIRKVIEQNRQKRLDELRSSVIAASFEELESSARIESAMAFGAGVIAGLEKSAQRIPEHGGSVDDELVERDRKRLRRFTRWLPFGPAVALRVFAVSLGALVVVSALTGPSGLPVLHSFTKPWGRVTALALLILGFMLYQRRLKATYRIRDRLNEALEKQLVDSVERWVVEARRQTLADLRSWIGTRPAWLDLGPVPEEPALAPTLTEWLGWVVHGSRRIRDVLRVRATERRDPSGLTSRYALDIPTSSSIATSELSDQLLEHAPDPADGARGIAVVIRPLCLPTSLPIPSDALMSTFWLRWLRNRIEPALWPDLGALLRDRPTVREAARRTIEMNTTPAIDADANAPAVSTKHYLAIDGAQDGTAFRQMFSADIDATALPRNRVTGSLTAVLDLALPDIALMLHLYALTADTQLPTGNPAPSTEDPVEGPSGP